MIIPKLSRTQLALTLGYGSWRDLWQGCEWDDEVYRAWDFNRGQTVCWTGRDDGTGAVYDVTWEGHQPIKLSHTEAAPRGIGPLGDWSSGPRPRIYTGGTDCERDARTVAELELFRLWGQLPHEPQWFDFNPPDGPDDDWRPARFSAQQPEGGFWTLFGFYDPRSQEWIVDTENTREEGTPDRGTPAPPPWQ